MSMMDLASHSHIMDGANPLRLNVTTLPLNLLKLILRSLLVSSDALPLDIQPRKPSRKAYTPVRTDLLRVCRLFFFTGLPILYGENIITASQSYAFDAHLLTLPPRNRQMITKIRLEIDWADHLWARFPLIALQLSHLRQLQKLEIFIVDRKKPEDIAGLMDMDPNQAGIVRHGPGKGTKREGNLADAMLKAEKKMLKDMVEGLSSLRVFKLKGFRDPVFAEKLEFEKSANCR